MSNETSEETKESIITQLKRGEKTQKEIAENHDVSTATVSRIKQAWNKGKMEGAKEASKSFYDFGKQDETESEEEDDYWCGYCEQENGEKVKVDYMDSECPNGHDLSGEWS